MVVPVSTTPLTDREHRVSPHRGKMKLAFGNATWDLMDDVIVGDRLVPRAIDVDFESVEGQPSLRMRIEVRDGAPICADLTISAADGGREIRSVDLRAVRLEEWVEDIVSAIAMKVESIAEDGTVTASHERSVLAEQAALKAIRDARRATRRNVEKILPEVARIYRARIDDRPVEAVQAAFGVSYRTAGRYVQLCRDADLLPPTTPGKKNA